MSEKRTTIVIVAKDLASGNISRVKRELNSLGPGGKAAALGLGGIGLAAGKAEQGLGHLKSTIGGLVSGPLGMIGLGGGIVGVGYAMQQTVTSAMQFDAAMELIKTQAGGTQAEVDSMKSAILAMAGSVGTAPDVLAAGLYHIESAGIRGAQALNILKIAAEGAKTGGSDLESTTNALVAAVESGVKGVSDMGGAMGTLNAIVGNGNMRMQDLTDAMTTGVLSAAKIFGVSLQSVGAALADMTNQGIPAIDAATRINSAMRLMAAPTKAAAKELASIGVGQLDLANAMRGPDGILGALTLLQQHMQKAGLIGPDGNPNAKGADLISHAFGGKQSLGIDTLIGSLGKLQTIQGDITKQAGGFGDAWASTEATAQAQWDHFTATIGALAIKLGNDLLPTVTSALDNISTWVDTHQGDIEGFFKQAIAVATSLGHTISTEILPPMMSIASGIKSMWDGLPAPLRDLIVKGIVADRTMKFLFGMSPISGVEGLIGKGIGGLLGKMFPSLGLNAGVANVKAGVVNVGGGIGGGGGSGPGNAVNAIEGVGGAGAALGLTTVVSGVLGILGAYWLPQYLAQFNSAAQARQVNTPSGGQYDLKQTGTTSLDFYQGLSPALGALIAKNTTVAQNTGATAANTRSMPADLSNVSSSVERARLVQQAAQQSADRGNQAISAHLNSVNASVQALDRRPIRVDSTIKLNAQVSISARQIAGQLVRIWQQGGQQLYGPTGRAF